ncbi:MAG: phospholipid-binding protein MlaC [Chthoniobacterales bacterium]
MKRSLSLFILSFAFIFIVAKPLHADSAEQRLRNAVDEVVTIASSQTNSQSLAKKLRPVLPRYINFEAMTRRAVGVSWRQFTQEQKSKTIDLFTTLIIDTYSNKFEPGAKPVINYKKAKPLARNRLEIPTDLLYKGSRYNVVYRMEKTSDWKISDIVIEGVSLVANYRTQFNSEFKKNGADGIIAALTRATK